MIGNIRRTLVISAVLSAVLTNLEAAHSSSRKNLHPEDSQQLASAYASDAANAKVQMEYAESLMARWANVENMAERAKVPNPYSHAKALVESYRERIGRDERRMSDYLNAANRERAETTH